MRRIAFAALAGLLLAGSWSSLGLMAGAEPGAAGGGTSPAGTMFADLTPEHWAAPQVQRLADAGVVHGNPDGLFRPDVPISRAELFKLVLSARRIDPGAQCDGLFRDVPCSAWYASVAETAYRIAVAEGWGEGLFGPDDPVTREQLFTIIVRALGRRWDAARLGWPEINARLGSFSDYSAISSWARPSVAWALGDDLARGYEDGTFRPHAHASRAEAAALVNRILLEGDLPVAEVDGRRVVYAQARAMQATKYATGEPGVGTITYTGLTVRSGTVAVDPNVIPLGRLLYVEGYGYAVAADIGGAIKGEKIDLFTDNYDLAAIYFGIQPRRVWVLP